VTFYGEDLYGKSEERKVKTLTGAD
jgi:hypothetical protein